MLGYDCVSLNSLFEFLWLEGVKPSSLRRTHFFLIMIKVKLCWFVKVINKYIN